MMPPIVRLALVLKMQKIPECPADIIEIRRGPGWILLHRRFPGFDDKNDLPQIGLGRIAAHHSLTIELLRDLADRLLHHPNPTSAVARV